MTSSPQLWRVAVDAPLPAPLTYAVPELNPESSELVRGTSVYVPLGRRKVSGIVLGPAADSGGHKIKPISELQSEKPVLSDSFVAWLEWLARYYVHPIGQVAQSVFPPLKKETGKTRARKGPVVQEQAAVAPPTLTPEQAKVIQSIQSFSGFQTHLVHGVTGSGKTEIYIRLLEQVIAQGKQGLVLVPEISLTPQLIDRFSQRLGAQVAVIHSHLTPREKTNQWWAMVEGEKTVLIGARSALFCPLPRLGMIILDEEHESSFKQDEKLKYHARDAAVMLGKFSECPVILGSATPSLESWLNVKRHRFHLHELKNRVENRPMPTIEVVDLRIDRELRKDEQEKQKEKFRDLPFWLSPQLKIAMDENLVRGEQTALFLNRRGIAQTVLCPACGYVYECPNCAVSLTLHGKNHLICHYCDYHASLGARCTDCKDGEPRALGLGTEMVEQDLAKMYPSARLIRMDRDEINSRESLEDAIRSVEKGEVDILVGTQMIAKGLDFPGLTLVGLVLADIAFNLPDFRASERAFQLLTQVSGRSGRHLRSGRVIIQTYNPEHPSVTYACAQNFSAFAEFELKFREDLGYPPYRRLACVRIQAADLGKAESLGRLVRHRAESLRAQRENFASIEVLGPAPAPLAKLRGQHRLQLLLKAPDAQTLGPFCHALLGDQDWVPNGGKVSLDIDAIHLL